jgi:hypothetical protein
MTIGRCAARRTLLSLPFLAVVTGATGASADRGATWDRHTRASRPGPKPAGVPSEYLLTRNGFFHPSCVITMRDDEVWGPDAFIRGLDGVVRDAITPCAHPRYGLRGNTIADTSPAVAVRSAATPHRPHPRGQGTYDGWLLYYDYTGSIGTGSSLSGQWIVPLLPKKVGTQDIAFFNDFETATLTLQAVLDLGEISDQWAIESENCCEMGNDLQSTLVAVSPGDVISGSIEATNCSTSGVCQNWTVTTTDVTTGQATILNTSAYGEMVMETNPAVLEAYNVTSCDMFPANGEVPFFDNQLAFADGASEPVTYTFQNCVQNLCAVFAGLPPGLPTNCGYGGRSAGNSHTLIFGVAPTPPPGFDAGELPDGGDGDDGGAANAEDATVGPSDGGGGGADGPADTARSTAGCGCAVIHRSTGGDRLAALVFGCLLYGWRRRRGRAA